MRWLISTKRRASVVIRSWLVMGLFFLVMFGAAEVHAADVVWTNVVNATATGNTLTNLSASWGSGDSTNLMHGDGSVSYTTKTYSVGCVNKRITSSGGFGVSDFGLSPVGHASSVPKYSVHVYTIDPYDPCYLGAIAEFKINGVTVANFTLSADNIVLTLERVADKITFKVDGLPKSTQTITAGEVLRADAYLQKEVITTATIIGASAPYTPPQAITDLVANPGFGNSGQVTLNWTAPFDNLGPITDYKVEYSTNYGSSWSLFNDGVSTATTAIVTGLSDTTPYTAVRFRVKAVNTYGTGPASNEIYGLPFSTENVLWYYLGSNTEVDGNTLKVGSARSSKYIGKDGGVDAIVHVRQQMSGYDFCQTNYGTCPATFGLSPSDYTPTGSTCKASVGTLYNSTAISKYAFHYPGGNYGNNIDICIDGTKVTTVAAPGTISNYRMRIERVNTEVRFIINNVIKYTVTTTDFTEPLFINAYTPRANGGPPYYYGDLEGSSIDDALLYGAGMQPPTEVTDLRALPIYSNGQISLIWSAPQLDNGSAVIDYYIEYNQGSGWQVFSHSASTTPGITVTGLNNAVPGTAAQFRVKAVNGIGASAIFSNIAYGFPFPATTVQWVNRSDKTTSVNGTFTPVWGGKQNFHGESFSVIKQDGGVEAEIILGGTNCNANGGSACSGGFGLATPGYTGTLPLYGFYKYAGDSGRFRTMVNGVNGGFVTYSATGIIRPQVSRAGSSIIYSVNGEVVKVVSGAPAGDLVGYAISNSGTSTSGNTAITSAVIYGAVSSPLVGQFNAVEVGANAVNGTLHTKVINQSFTIDIVALNETGDDQLTTFASDRTHVLTFELVDANTGTSCATRTQILSSTLPSLIFNNADNATEQGRKSYTVPAVNAVYRPYPRLALRIRDSLNPDATIVWCSFDTFAARPDHYTLRVSHADWQTAGSSANIETLGYTSLPANPEIVTPTHKAGRPFHVDIRVEDPANNPIVYLGNNSNTYNVDIATVDIPNITIGGGITAVTPIANQIVQTDAQTVTLSFNSSFYPAWQPQMGVARIDLYFNEVGWAQLEIRDTSLLTASDFSDGSTPTELYVPTVTQYVGRFVPDHFARVNMVSADIEAGINDIFTYMGQPFDIAVTDVIEARRFKDTNPQDGLADTDSPSTVNYKSDFCTLVVNQDGAPTDTAVAVNSDGSSATLSSNFGSVLFQPSTTNEICATASAGQMTINFTANGLSYARNANPVRPFDAKMDLPVTIGDSDIGNISDTVNVVPDPVSGQPEQRYGQVFLVGKGEETGPADQTHFAFIQIRNVGDDGVWHVNEDDGCGGVCSPGSPVGLNHLILESGANTTVVSPGNEEIIVAGGGSTTVSGGTWDEGEYQLGFSPLTAGTGVVKVTVGDLNATELLPTWLPINSSINICFGCDSGPRNIMYQRELWR